MKKSYIVLIAIFIAILPILSFGQPIISKLIEGKPLKEALNVVALETEKNTQDIATLKNGAKQQEKYNEFKVYYDQVWLKSKTEEETVKDTMGYCAQAINENNAEKQAKFCPLAKNLQNSWNEYKTSLGEKTIFDDEYTVWPEAINNDITKKEAKIKSAQEEELRQQEIVLSLPNGNSLMKYNEDAAKRLEASQNGMLAPTPEEPLTPKQQKTQQKIAELQQQRKELSKTINIKAYGERMNALSELYSDCREILPEWTEDLKYTDIDFDKCLKHMNNRLVEMENKLSSLENIPENQVDIYQITQSIGLTEKEIQKLPELQKDLEELEKIYKK